MGTVDSRVSYSRVSGLLLVSEIAFAAAVLLLPYSLAGHAIAVVFAGLFAGMEMALALGAPTRSQLITDLVVGCMWVIAAIVGTVSLIGSMVS
jgi:hypothetical protein